MANYKTIDYMNDHHERKKVANLIQTGNFRVISTKRHRAVNIHRNRIILAVLAVLVFLTGLYSIIF